jgi:hypothetical protein
MKDELLFQKSNKYKPTVKIKKLHAIKDHVIVTDMYFGERKLNSGIVLLNDDERSDGIRPRWAQVYAVGPEQHDVQVGQWVLVEHGRWTRGLKVEIDNNEFVIRRADPKCIIFVSDDEPPADETISDKLHMSSKSRD